MLPKIVAGGREWKRRWQVCLRVEGLPQSARPPFTLASVAAAAENCLWETVPQPVYSRMVLHVTVPLLCQVRDCNGCMFSTRAFVELDVCLQVGRQGHDCWRASLMLTPCARLVCLPCPSEDGCFDALLEVLVEAYMIRWEACATCSSKPACPPSLPLYPHLREE